MDKRRAIQIMTKAAGIQKVALAMGSALLAIIVTAVMIWVLS